MRVTFQSRGGGAVVDSLALSRQSLERLSDSLHIALLERGQQQAELTSSWVGISVGVLGVMFAVLAIGTAIALHRQSVKIKEAFAEEFKRYQSMVDGFIAEMQSKWDAEAEKVRVEIKKTQKRLKSAKAEDRAALERRIKRLEERESSLEKASPAALGWPTSLAVGSTKRLDRCDRCGYTLSAADRAMVQIASLSIGRRMCPRCKQPMQFGLLDLLEDSK